MTEIRKGFTEKEQELLKAVASVMNPFFKQMVGSFCEMSQKDVLKNLGIMDYQMIDALIHYATPEEIDQIITTSAEKMMEKISTFDPKNYNKLKWREHIIPIIDSIKAEFPEVFRRVDFEIQQINIQRNLQNKISGTEGRVKRCVTALMNEEEAATNKGDIHKLFDDLKEIVSATELTNDRMIEVLNEIENARKDALDFVDTKLQEEPVRICYFRSGNRPRVKVNLNGKSWGYQSGRGKEVHFSRLDDREQYPILVSVDYIEDFLYQNEIRDEDVWVDPESLESFYSFNGRISINLTPAFVAEWWNCDCPNLMRCEPNKYRHTNMLGMPSPHFSTQLVETSCTTDYIDEDITEDEVRRITQGREHTRMYRSMTNALKAKSLKDEKEKVEELKFSVEAFDGKVQKAIDDHRYEILRYIAQAFPTRVTFEKVSGMEDLSPEVLKTMQINDNFGFDCGFFNILTTDNDYTQNRDLLHNIDPNAFPWMNVRMPISSQSLTLMRTQFSKVREIVKRELGINLYKNEVLD